MTWQRVVDHITMNPDGRIRVESRAGNQYPVRTEYDSDNEMVYKWAMGDLAPDELWADVDFSGDEPTTDRIHTGHPSGGPPQH